MLDANDQARKAHCENGHEIEFRGPMARAFCPICNAPIIPEHMIKQLQTTQTEDTHNDYEKLEKSGKPLITDTVAHVITAPPKMQEIENCTQLEKSTIPMQVPSRIEHTSNIRCVEVPNYSPISTIDNNNNNNNNNRFASLDATRKTSDEDSKVQDSNLRFDYFGEKILIPACGGWIGRDSIGKELFLGNRLISRQHVYIHPEGNGKIKIGPDKSLNGSFYDTGHGKKKLEAEEIVEVGTGTIVWVYNIPLVLECRS